MENKKFSVSLSQESPRCELSAEDGFLRLKFNVVVTATINVHVATFLSKKRRQILSVRV